MTAPLIMSASSRYICEAELAFIPVQLILKSGVIPLGNVSSSGSLDLLEGPFHDVDEPLPSQLSVSVLGAVGGFDISKHAVQVVVSTWHSLCFLGRSASHHDLGKPV